MASFLNPLIKGEATRYCLTNARTGQVIADTLLTAFDSASRKTGLLNHESMPTGHALIIAPCNSIHMFFMKFPIDVAFVAKDGTVLKMYEALRPWRLAASLKAFAAIELRAGALAGSDTRKGDRVLVSSHEGVGADTERETPTR